MRINNKYDKIVLILILVSAIIRAIIAQLIDFGNDEVYYWTYALYPALSHFDHPPMLGWLIQIFTFNLSFDSELFIRMGSIILGMANTWFIYIIAIKLKNHQAGLFTVFLYLFCDCGNFYLTRHTTNFFLVIKCLFIDPCCFKTISF